VAGCHVSYSAYHHDYPAADIFAARGCHFVAATAGTVDEVGFTDKWKSSTNRGADRGGLFVSIVGDDGVRYYGSHLSAIAAGIAPGTRVNAGDLLGLVGNSGDARGIATHVHYGFSWPTSPGIWWVRRGWISPYKYLTSWQAGVGRSPSSAIAAAHAAAGDTPKCKVDC
jgi:murein DD-endopeptidase MepM/ murein hydrolase activator NlpD